MRGAQPGPGETDPPEVLDLMHRVTLIPTVRRTLFGPRITVFTKDGRSFTKEGTGREFIWDFEEEARRIRPVAPGLAIGEAQFAELIDTCRHLDRLDRRSRQADRADHPRLTAAQSLPVPHGTIWEPAGASPDGRARPRGRRSESQDSLWRPLCSLLRVGRHLEGERTAADSCSMRRFRCRKQRPDARLAVPRPARDGRDRVFRWDWPPT